MPETRRVAPHIGLDDRDDSTDVLHTRQPGVVLSMPRRDDREKARGTNRSLVPGGADGRMQIPLTENTRVEQQARLLLTIARQLSGQSDVGAIHRLALDMVESEIAGARAVLAVLDDDTGTFSFCAFGTRGVLWRQVPSAFAASDCSFGDAVMRGCTGGASAPTEVAFDRAARAAGIASLVAVPVSTAGTCTGLLLVGWTRTPPGDFESVWFLENIGVHIGVACHTARLHTELESSIAVLRSAQQSLARTEPLRALGEMASGVVHDFNNSLTTILGLSDALLHTLPADAEGREDLEKIRTSSMDAAALVRRLQHAGRLTTTADEPESVDLVEVTREVAELCRLRWAALVCRPGVDFQVHVDTERVPSVRAVAAEIRELLTNLVFNAIDAMPGGGHLTLRTRMVDGAVQLSVADDGCGVPEHLSARIFEPFFTTKGDQGSGLGLSMCWGIAKRHGGTLDVQSEVGIGTTFTLTLPADDAAATPRRSEPTHVARVPSQRILLVDHQADVRESLTDMLEALGHHVTTEADGADAVRSIDLERFDLLITDLGLPGVNGLEVAEHARVSNPLMPVLLLTALGTDYGSVVPDHVNLVLSKPVTVRGLEQALGRTIGEAGVDVTGVSEEQREGRQTRR
jgi:signal transduction histidine kinase/ActR/RegA family two-component response regulator